MEGFWPSLSCATSFRTQYISHYTPKQSLALERRHPDIPDINEPLLRRIAQAGGGRYYRPDEARTWLASLKPTDYRIGSPGDRGAGWPDAGRFATAPAKPSWTKTRPP